MATKAIFYISSLVIVPALFTLFYGARLLGRVYAIDQWVPKWDTLLILATMITLERIYTYRFAISQRSVLARDLISNVVNLYITGAVTGMIVLPILVFFPEHFLGRKLVLASPAQLGPFWLQVLVILLLVSFFPLLGAPLATWDPVSMGTSLIPSPSDRSTSLKYICLSSDRFCSQKRCNISSARRYRL
jgi:hypothetical protein